MKGKSLFGYSASRTHTDMNVCTNHYTLIAFLTDTKFDEHMYVVLASVTG